jgi:transcriptional regulator with XRE-family HTH domain
MTEHKLAIVRKNIGFHQVEMANVLGVTVDAIKSIESGRMKLSQDLAERVQRETGVTAEWLLADDITKPIQFTMGPTWWLQKQKEAQLQEMTVAKSRQIITDLRKAQHVGACAIRFLSFWELITKLISIAAKAVKCGKFSLFLFKLRKMMTDLEGEFQCDTELDARLQKEIRLRERLNPRNKKGVGRITPAVLDLQPLSEAVSAIFFSVQKKSGKFSASRSL